jgi:hypothetical protein
MPEDHISQQRAVYTIAGMERAIVRKDIVYRTTDAGPLTMDVHSPADAPDGARMPAVIMVAGYNDVGYEKMLGCRFKEMAMTGSWAQLIAASGMIAIAYTNREPAADLDALLEHVRQHAGALGVDESRLGVWACSGNVPLALSVLLRRSTTTPGPKGPGLRDDARPGLQDEARSGLRCGALLYGYMLDLDGATGVAEAARMFRFTNPNAGCSLDDLPPQLALFIVRAGQEQFPHLNDSIDRFVARALALNRPITVVNYATGPHSFDLLQDSDASREIIRAILDFLRAQLTRAGS